MTPARSVARTETEHIWSAGLRIREAAETSSNLKKPGMSSAEVLRGAAGYLQAGWRWLERKRAQQLSSRRLQLAETISLGDKRSVSIVQVDGAQFLIGCSTGSVQLLAILDKQSDTTKPFPNSERPS